VVAGGIALLTVIGVAAIFGDSIAALVASPRAEKTASVSAGADRTDQASPVGAKRSTRTAARDGGSIAPPDGSS
jgi:hypothetical protein